MTSQQPLAKAGYAIAGVVTGVFCETSETKM